MPWRRSTPFLLTAYAAVHIWWAVSGPPDFDSFGESFIPGAWTPVGISLTALAASLLLLRETRRPWGIVALGWAAGLGMVLYSFMFALDLVSILFGEFTTADWTGFLIRGLGAAWPPTSDSSAAPTRSSATSTLTSRSGGPSW